MAGLPETDVARVRRWCGGRVPPEMVDEMRVECDVADRHLTVVECRPPWDEDFSSEWTRMPIARLHYVRARQEWTLFWRDRHERWHRHDDTPATHSVQDLLDELGSVRDPIFWG